MAQLIPQACHLPFIQTQEHWHQEVSVLNPVLLLGWLEQVSLFWESSFYDNFLKANFTDYLVSFILSFSDLPGHPSRYKGFSHQMTNGSLLLWKALLKVWRDGLVEKTLALQSPGPTQIPGTDYKQRWPLSVEPRVMPEHWQVWLRNLSQSLCPQRNSI